MTDLAIRVDNLGKRYHIGRVRAAHATLREGLNALLMAPAHRVRRWFAPVGGEDDPDRHDPIIWALRNVSFEVPQGQVLGVVGRNGAGKSTLLKVLSRITTPTEGRAEILRRVGSLLEVGVGFHPELTGRENIQLSGSIMGMRKAEIRRRFDEIVAFAEIEKFLDTPVKRYSSGMYVRLAFAVAAHLEPEILLVDEVLAVGDAAFQKKCLGKMGDVSRQGRTVLFVSHNMGAVSALCERCLLIDHGRLVKDGPAAEVTAFYQSSLYAQAEDLSDLRDVERYGSGKAKFTSAAVYAVDSGGRRRPYLQPGQDLRVELNIAAEADVDSANVALVFYDLSGYRLIDANTALRGSFLSLRAGQAARVRFHLHNVLLKPGTYLLGLWLGRADVEDIDGITYVTSVAVEPDLAAAAHSQVFPGVYQCRFSHEVEVRGDEAPTTP